MFPISHRLRPHRTKMMLAMAWVVAPLCALPHSYFFRLRTHPIVADYQQCTPIGSFPSVTVVIFIHFFTIKMSLSLGAILLLLCSQYDFCNTPYRHPGQLHGHHHHHLQEVQAIPSVQRLS